MITATAPGKMVLMGEYAVLYGHTAVVAAVDVRATCRIRGGPLNVQRDRGGLIEAVLAVVGDVDGDMDIDTLAFREGNAKYGLGSSAAACVAMIRAWLPHLQLDEVHALAQKAHRAFQKGQGSGIDVCASVYGGIQRFTRVDGDTTTVVRHRGIPAGITVIPVFTGQSADTRVFLDKVQRLPDIEKWVAPLGRAARDFCAARDRRDVYDAISEAARHMAQLGAAAGCDIDSVVHQYIRSIAEGEGGAAKPSGAGGGDIALVFADSETADDIATLITDAGFTILDIAVGAPGVDVVGDAS